MLNFDAVMFNFDTRKDEASTFFCRSLTNQSARAEGNRSSCRSDGNPRAQAAATSSTPTPPTMTQGTTPMSDATRPDSNAPLYQYFPNKLALVEAVRQRHFDEVLAILRAAADDTLSRARRFEALVDGMIGVHGRYEWSPAYWHRRSPVWSRNGSIKYE